MSDERLAGEILDCMSHGGINDFNIGYFESSIRESVLAGTKNEVILGMAEELGII